MRYYIGNTPDSIARTKYVLAALGFLALGAAQADTLSITLQNITERSGKVMLSIGGEAAFNDQGEPTAQAILEPSQDEIVFMVDALPRGEYAVRVMHDVNGNGKLDTNIAGIPKEPYGFSNNARGNFGPPTFADAKFTINGDTAIAITME